MPDITKPFDETSKALAPKQQQTTGTPRLPPSIPPGSTPTMRGGDPTPTAWGSTVYSPTQFGWIAPGGKFFADPTAVRQYSEMMRGYFRAGNKAPPLSMAPQGDDPWTKALMGTV